MSTIITRMGDATTVEMTRDELHRDIIEGSEAAAARGKVPVLEEREVEYLLEMFSSPSRIWGSSAVTRRSSPRTAPRTRSARRACRAGSARH